MDLNQGHNILRVDVVKKTHMMQHTIYVLLESLALRTPKKEIPVKVLMLIIYLALQLSAKEEVTY